MAKRITESEFVRRAAREAEVDKAVMQKCWVGVINAFIDLYCDGNTLTVRDLGVFRLRKTKPRVGYDFRTGEKNVQIAGSATPVFKPCATLRKTVGVCYRERVEQGLEDELPDED